MLSTRPTLIKECLALYRRRNERFGSALFAASCWEIILELAIHRDGMTHDELVSINYCKEGTLGRWLTVLEQQGIVQTTLEPENSTRRFTLTEAALEGLGEVLRPFPINT